MTVRVETYLVSFITDGGMKLIETDRHFLKQRYTEDYLWSYTPPKHEGDPLQQQQTGSLTSILDNAK